MCYGVKDVPSRDKNRPEGPGTPESIKEARLAGAQGGAGGSWRWKRAELSGQLGLVGYSMASRSLS